MLSVAGEHIAAHNPKARLVMYGQELNAESYAICKADMLIKAQDIANIIFGNTLSADGLPDKTFDYALSNPPFGVEWKKIEKEIRKEAETDGFNGRFGPGLPRVSDGSLLFLLHLISKMRPAKDGGSRFGIVLNGSPLFTGGAGDDQLVYVNHVLMGKLMESETLKQQASSNTKEQFGNSPDLNSELMNAVMDAQEAHTTMSTKVLNSAAVLAEIKDILLNHSRLWEALRSVAESPGRQG